MLDLDSDVQYVRGVGPRRAALLRARGISNVLSLLVRFPRRYEDRRHLASIHDLSPGRTATLRVSVSGVRLIPTRSRGRILDVVFTDGASALHAKWFNGSRLYKNRVFTPGVEVILNGRVEHDKYEGGIVLFNPEFEIVTADAEEASGSYVPIYEEAAGITSRQFRKMIVDALDALRPRLADPLPEEVRTRRSLPELSSALEAIHRPGPEADLELLNARRSPAHRRFKFEELFLFELGTALRRHRTRTSDGIRFETGDALREQIRKILPFRPTPAQKRVFGEIVEDLRAAFPMNRLLQGDVGCGKTIVALEGIVVAIENGYQASLMVPTEILAEQHAISARRILAPLGYPIGLVRKGTRREDPDLLERIRMGEVPLVIGTHALLEEAVEFRRLGLVVIDEQHRFGVLQRMNLMQKGARPNTLVMTATPIPRTLAMTFYGELDVSSIDELPPGRRPVETIHVPDSARERVEQALDAEVVEGRQCYVVYPLVEESEKLDLRSAVDGYERLSARTGLHRVGLLHGRMKSAEKEAVMQAFAAGDIAVLVTTTVVEVGVDVPNATLIVIEHAERFGIAQLHQLRGRVGRGPHPSRCLLVTPNRLAQMSRDRIRAVVASTDGFRLAEADLRLRGPGDLAGTRQSGMPEFRHADLIDDVDILIEARDEAEHRVEDSVERARLVEGLSRQRGRAGVVGVG